MLATFRRSSGVERALGKGEAESSILSGGTIFFSLWYLLTKLPRPLAGGRVRRDQESRRKFFADFLRRKWAAQHTMHPGTSNSGKKNDSPR